jgi:hypothetical protein
MVDDNSVKPSCEQGVNSIDFADLRLLSAQSSPLERMGVERMGVERLIARQVSRHCYVNAPARRRLLPKAGDAGGRVIEPADAFVVSPTAGVMRSSDEMGAPSWHRSTS